MAGRERIGHQRRQAVGLVGPAADHVVGIGEKADAGRANALGVDPIEEFAKELFVLRFQFVGIMFERQIADMGRGLHAAQRFDQHLVILGRHVVEDIDGDRARVHGIEVRQRLRHDFPIDGGADAGVEERIRIVDDDRNPLILFHPLHRIGGTDIVEDALYILHEGQRPAVSCNQQGRDDEEYRRQQAAELHIAVEAPQSAAQAGLRPFPWVRCWEIGCNGSH